jgi:vacuolar-type H+-ATPase subunit C/Vma6
MPGNYDVKNIGDIEYLYISTRLRALEHDMLGREGLMRLIHPDPTRMSASCLRSTAGQAFDPKDLTALEQENLKTAPGDVRHPTITPPNPEW